MDNGANHQENSFFKEALLKIWNNIFLVIIIVVLSVLAGVGYTYLKKPTYTATVSINYTAKLNDNNSTTVDNISVMKGMMQSVVDLSVSEIVLEEANYLYECFLKSAKSVDDFITEVKEGNNADYVYNSNNRASKKYYDVSEVNSYALSTSEDSSGPKYIFNISVSDKDARVAKNKVRILALAGNRVSKSFFEFVTTSLEELITSSNQIGVSSDISVKKNVVIFGFIGVVLSLVVVYLKYFLDNTAKNKDEIERITGTNVIAFIEDQEEN